MDSTPCNWCAPKPGLPFIADRIGFFSDFDCDLSYGLGVCGGCGGIGIQVEGEDFTARTKRIMKIRFEYCPTDNLPPPPICVQLHALKNLKVELVEHYRLYGEGRECYAKLLLDTELDRLILQYEEVDAVLVAYYESVLPKDVPDPERVRQMTLAAVRGELDEAEQKYRAYAEEINDSVAWHDLGTFLVTFRRNAEQALVCYQTSCDREPKKYLHFVQTAHLLELLNRRNEVLSFLRQATECPDFRSQGQKTRL